MLAETGKETMEDRSLTGRRKEERVENVPVDMLNWRAVLFHLRHEDKETVRAALMADAAHDVRLAEAGNRFQDYDLRLPIGLVHLVSARDRLLQQAGGRLMDRGHVECRVEQVSSGEAIIGEGVREQRAVHVAPPNKRVCRL